MDDENTTNTERLNDTNENATISATDEAQASAGAATAPEDAHYDARDTIIEQQRQQIDLLMKQTQSLNDQISKIIRNGGAIGTHQNVEPQPQTMTSENIETPDFDAIAKDLINMR